ncbi:hypothetical protein NPIL_15581 [Nephila pilipes]|uniref:histone acetyltransferase n=1 Tax=Nephila pilipes TaxID=299642 RepID=A0A8X6PX99_NEPPI|nr:hypothetical protein NPIL_15581 [Nephila pilipes]
MNNIDFLNIPELQSDQDVWTWYQKSIKCNEWGRLKYLRWQQTLEHARICTNTACLSECDFMKRVFSHARNCLVILKGTCAICKQLITQNYFHAPLCTDRNCLLPYCANVKLKFRMHRKLRLNFGDLRERHPDINPFRRLLENASAGRLAHSNSLSQSFVGPLLKDSLRILEIEYDMTPIPFPSGDFFKHVQEVQDAYPRLSVLPGTSNGRSSIGSSSDSSTVFIRQSEELVTHPDVLPSDYVQLRRISYASESVTDTGK